MTQYKNIMEKHIHLHNLNLTDKGITRTDNLIEDLGKVGLNQGLGFAKGLIENYFLNHALSQPIIDLIEKNQFIQETAEKLKAQIK